MLFSGVFGWWGFPWGLVMTPVQLARNLVELTGGPKSDAPSALLQKFVRMHAGARVAQASTARRLPPAPAPSQSLPPVISTVTQGVGDERYMPRA
jgi:hypothetical protein